MSESKQMQPYFPHYGNARNEDNLTRLRIKHGPMGYGLYYMLLERLRMADNYICALDYDVLMFDFHCEQDIIESVIFDFGLFEISEDGNYFSSIELSSYMRFMEEKKQKRAEAARIAANARWGKTTSETNEEDKPSVSSATQPKASGLKLSISQEVNLIKYSDKFIRDLSLESGYNDEEISSLLSKFEEACIKSGKECGHKNLDDAMVHFRSYVMKSSKTNSCTASQKASADKLAKEEARRHEETVERNRKYDERRANSGSPDNTIRNMGYEPSVVGVKCFDPNWRDDNPPTHPEWMGKYKNGKPIDKEQKAAV